MKNDDYVLPAQQCTLYIKQYTFKDEPHIMPYEEVSSSGDELLLGSITLDIPEQRFSAGDVVEKTIQLLVSEREKAEKEFEDKTRAIDEQIKNLQALTYQAD